MTDPYELCRLQASAGKLGQDAENVAGLAHAGLRGTFGKGQAALKDV